jgi:hypothetical protein
VPSGNWCHGATRGTEAGSPTSGTDSGLRSKLRALGCSSSSGGLAHQACCLVCKNSPEAEMTRDVEAVRSDAEGMQRRRRGDAEAMQNKSGRGRNRLGSISQPMMAMRHVERSHRVVAVELHRELAANNVWGLRVYSVSVPTAASAVRT